MSPLVTPGQPDRPSRISYMGNSIFLEVEIIRTGGGNHLKGVNTERKMRPKSEKEDIEKRGAKCNLLVII